MQAQIRIGIGGWTYAPWRGVFYPEKLAQKEELAYASRQLTSIEINGTFYGAQKPESFAKWHTETPEDFVFALKGPRFVTQRRALAEAGEAVERFFASGVLLLKDKLGPINWQLAPTKKFDAADVEGFFKLLPRNLGGRTIRHAIEVRHDSFATPDFVALAQACGVAIVFAGDSAHPQIEDAGAPFVYARIMGTREAEPLGYSDAELDAWAERARRWAAAGRDVFLYVIAGAKPRNPLAARALVDRLKAR